MNKQEQKTKVQSLYLTKQLVAETDNLILNAKYLEARLRYYNAEDALANYMSNNKNRQKKVKEALNIETKVNKDDGEDKQE
jgi:hypothetical protein